MQTSADGKKLFRSSLIVLSVLAGTTALVTPVRPAFALSELKHQPGETPQKPADEADKAAPVEKEQQEDASPLELPLPDPLSYDFDLELISTSPERFREQMQLLRQRFHPMRMTDMKLLAYNEEPGPLALELKRGEKSIDPLFVDLVTRWPGKDKL